MAVLTLYPNQIQTSVLQSNGWQFVWTDYTNAGTPYTYGHGNGDPELCTLTFAPSSELSGAVINSATLTYRINATTDTSTSTGLYAEISNTFIEPAQSTTANKIASPNTVGNKKRRHHIVV